jgi:hypothetical protein
VLCTMIRNILSSPYATSIAFWIIPIQSQKIFTSLFVREISSIEYGAIRHSLITSVREYQYNANFLELSHLHSIVCSSQMALSSSSKLTRDHDLLKPESVLIPTSIKANPRQIGQIKLRTDLRIHMMQSLEPQYQGGWDERWSIERQL